jgi:hypothetical protein
MNNKELESALGLMGYKIASKVIKVRELQTTRTLKYV